MTKFSATFQERHLGELRDRLFCGGGVERAAYVFFGEAAIEVDPWLRETQTRFLSVRTREVPEDDVLSADPTHISWSTNSFVNALKEAERDNHTVAIVHTHPSGLRAFSPQDDSNECDLLQLALNRNGPGTRLLSFVFAGEHDLIGRVWLHPEKKHGHERISRISTIGKSIEISSHGRNRGSDQFMQRQALAFGPALNEELRDLRVGVVGCGGTGSATAMLLARLGVGQIALFDDDIVDVTNLNRLHGASQADADAMNSKVFVVARSITSLGLGVRVIERPGWVGESANRDAMKACDVIFGCTDDHDGRLFLNRWSYYYLTPVIDMGLAIDVSETDPPEIETLEGRVTVLGPGHTCLMCSGLIDPEIARGEAMKRKQPAEYEKQKREAYVAGEGDPSPAVVTFTTEVACMAINELLQRMQGFRGTQGNAANRLRKFNLGEDRLLGYRPRVGCRICDDDGLWGRGDTDPFLGRVE